MESTLFSGLLLPFMTFFLGVGTPFGGPPVPPVPPPTIPLMEIEESALPTETFEVVPETGIDYRPLAQCMTEQGWVMYGADWCPHCQDQKADFGAAFELIEYIECTQEPELCEEAGIMGYPTWVSNGISHPGRKNVWQLSEMSGCTF